MMTAVIILFQLLTLMHTFVHTYSCFSGGGGFGKRSVNSNNNKSSSKRSKNGYVAQNLNDIKVSDKARRKKGFTYVKSEQDQMLQQLAMTASLSPLGRAIAESPLHGTPHADPFWELIPSLVASKFPNVKYDQLNRVAGFIRHTLNPSLPKDASLMMDPWRPHEDLHAYMPDLGETKPFYDPIQFSLCSKLSENIDVVTQEYEALLREMEYKRKDLFQSVTSMNYEAGWKTVVLFYNGHRIEDFPYHLCPVTTQILESVPLAGRIAGFNRQLPNSGIPLHSDGNNMWLTCQMGVKIPEDGTKAYIRVGPEKRFWKRGECLVYDTTYEHETMNESLIEERVVLHVDFFNILAMTPIEIEIMRYIYSMRENYLKAEGVRKVDKQML